MLSFIGSANKKSPLRWCRWVNVHCPQPCSNRPREELEFRNNKLLSFKCYLSDGLLCVFLFSWCHFIQQERSISSQGGGFIMNLFFCNISSLLFSFWKCECRVSLATWALLTQGESRLPPCRPRELPLVLRRANPTFSPPQGATPLMDLGTIYHACSMDNYVFLFFFCKKVELGSTVSVIVIGCHQTDQNRWI